LNKKSSFWGLDHINANILGLIIQSKSNIVQVSVLKNN
jgi:hypothetical protein